MTKKTVAPPPVTPQDVLDELSAAADSVLNAQEELVNDVQEALADLEIHNEIPEAHGFEDPKSSIRETIVSEAQRIHEGSGIGTAHKELKARVAVTENDIALLKGGLTDLEASVADPTPATSDKCGAVKPDSLTTRVATDGSLSVITSVAATPNSIVKRDVNGDIVGNITGTARTAVYA